MNVTPEIECGVNAIVEELKIDGTTRFSKADFQSLVFAVLSDKTFDAKRYFINNDELVEDPTNVSAGFYKFMDKLLKHAGVSSASERESIIETFEYTPRDVEWVADCVDEAMWLYAEAGKNMRLFRGKAVQLSIRKMERSGKYGKRLTYKKSIMDRALALKKRKDKKGVLDNEG